MAPRPPIQAVVEQADAFEEDRRHWRIVLFTSDREPIDLATLAAAAGITLPDVQAAIESGDIVVPGGGVAIEDVQAALDDGSLALPQNWRGFNQAGPVAQSFWNSWSQLVDQPVLFRKVGTQIQMMGHAVGGVAAPGNAIVQMPDNVAPVLSSQDFPGNLRVVIIGGHTYIVMIAGGQSEFDLGNIVYTTT